MKCLGMEGCVTVDPLSNNQPNTGPENSKITIGFEVVRSDLTQFRCSHH